MNRTYSSIPAILLAFALQAAAQNTPPVVTNQIATNTLPAAIKTISDARRVVFNDYLDAAVAAFFMLSVLVILTDSVREWYACLAGRKQIVSSEVPFTGGALQAGD